MKASVSHVRERNVVTPPNAPKCSAVLNERFVAYSLRAHQHESLVSGSICAVNTFYANLIQHRLTGRLNVPSADGFAFVKTESSIDTSDDEIGQIEQSVPSDRCMRKNSNHRPHAKNQSQADPAVSGQSVLDAIQDTEAFVAANDEILLVVFRGTKELTDWTTNLKFALRSAPEEWGVKEGCDLHQVSYLVASFAISFTRYTYNSRLWVLVFMSAFLFVVGVMMYIERSGWPRQTYAGAFKSTNKVYLGFCRTRRMPEGVCVQVWLHLVGATAEGPGEKLQRRVVTSTCLIGNFSLQ